MKQNAYRIASTSAILICLTLTPGHAVIERCDAMAATSPALFGPNGQYATAIQDGRYQEVLWALRDAGHREAAEGVRQCLQAIMTEGDIQGVENLGGGISRTEKVTLPNNVSGVFKSTNSYDGCFRHELAAYALDQRLELDTVPMTVERTIDGKSGSLQYFVSNAVPAHQATGAVRTPELKVLDLLIDNEDRHAANWLYYEFDGHRRLFGIDHNLSFGCRREAHLKVHEVKIRDLDRITRLRVQLEGLSDDELESLLDGLVSRKRAIRKAGKTRERIIWRLKRLEQASAAATSGS